MTAAIEIQDGLLHIDTARTRDFYLTQKKIIEDCTCGDCNFYATVFTKEPIEIFGLLSSMGIDLEKNLQSEPTGVWCVRTGEDGFLYCEQVYRAAGQILPAGRKEIIYEKVANGFKVEAVFQQDGTDIIYIVLRVSKV